MNVSMNRKRDENSAAIKGAAVGAAIGMGIGAAAVVLSDKNKREKLLKKTEQLKKDAKKTLTNGKKEMLNIKKSFDETVSASLPEAKDLDEMVDDAKATSKKTVKRSTKKK